MTEPTLLVEVVFLSPQDGGRQAPPIIGTPTKYRPHLVVQDRGIRQARLRWNVVEEDYLGVSFIEGPGRIDFDEPVRCVLKLDYVPEVDYSNLREGATFTVREGPFVVAHGIVLERRSAS